MKLDYIINQIVRIEIRNQIDFSRKIISILRENGSPEAIIAGGAPRNWHRRLLANDVDIYVRGFSNDCKIPPLHRRSSRQNYPDPFSKIREISNYVNINTESAYNNDFEDTVIENVHSFKMLGVIDIQIIEINDGTPEYARCSCLGGFQKTACPICFQNSVFKFFDFGICKIAHNGTDFLPLKKDYTDDNNNDTLTLKISDLADLPGLNRLPKRLEKMRRYFPNNKVVFK